MVGVLYDFFKWYNAFMFTFLNAFKLLGGLWVAMANKSNKQQQ